MVYVALRPNRVCNAGRVAPCAVWLQCRGPGPRPFRCGPNLFRPQQIDSSVLKKRVGDVFATWPDTCATAYEETSSRTHPALLPLSTTMRRLPCTPTDARAGLPDPCAGGAARPLGRQQSRRPVVAASEPPTASGGARC